MTTNHLNYWDYSKYRGHKIFWRSQFKLWSVIKCYCLDPFATLFVEYNMAIPGQHPWPVKSQTLGIGHRHQEFLLLESDSSMYTNMTPTELNPVFPFRHLYSNCSHTVRIKGDSNANSLEQLLDSNANSLECTLPLKFLKNVAIKICPLIFHTFYFYFLKFHVPAVFDFRRLVIS